MVPLLRFGWRLAAFMGLMSAVFLGRADDISTNAPGIAAPPPFVSPPLLSTNPASSSFLESHPELVQPSQPDQQSLSLRPGSTPGSEPPVVNPSDTEAFHFLNPGGPSEDLAEHLLVVYNQNDPDSKGLADYYAARRNIPEERVLSISCSTAEEITRAQYEETIRQPIISYICQKNWMTRHSKPERIGGTILDLLVATHNDIWAIVLMRGVPLKIAPDPSDTRGMEQEEALQTNAAAVDSELALLPIFGLPMGGYVPNVFYDSKATGFERVGPELAKSIILVTRLDGPKPEDVRRMIDDSLYAEQNRLAGLAVIDTRGITDLKSGYILGDIWLRGARDMLVQNGWTVKFDDKDEVLPATDPCNHVAIYLGWYAPEAVGPWVTPPNRFVRGAIAYHLHSFSAGSVRSETGSWVGPLITHGAAATMGTVYEPYLALTPQEDIFTKRLLDGDYFAEAAYASQKGLSWMGTVVGDPLYRPFRQPLRSALASVSIPHTDHDDWLLLQEVQRELLAGRIEADSDSLEHCLDVPGAGGVAYEGLGDLLEKFHDPLAGPSTEQAYQKAITSDTLPIDQIRVGLKLAQYYSNHAQDARALAELDTMRELYPVEAKRFGVADLLVPTSASPSHSPTDNPPPASRGSSSLPVLPTPPKPPQPQPASGPQ